MGSEKDEVVTLENTGQGTIVAGQIRLEAGKTIKIKESAIPEGLRRLVGGVIKKS